VTPCPCGDPHCCDAPWWVEPAQPSGVPLVWRFLAAVALLTVGGLVLGGLLGLVLLASALNQ
jgi:hypothetical protein